jgi:hypothetical protein
LPCEYQCPLSLRQPSRRFLAERPPTPVGVVQIEQQREGTDISSSQVHSVGAGQDARCTMKLLRPMGADYAAVGPCLLHGQDGSYSVNS